MIKKIVLWYLHKISLEQCTKYECGNCPFGCKECICSVLKVERVLKKI